MEEEQVETRMQISDREYKVLSLYYPWKCLGVNLPIFLGIEGSQRLPPVLDVQKAAMLHVWKSILSIGHLSTTVAPAKVNLKLTGHIMSP